MHERRARILIAVGGLALVALLLVAGSAVASNSAAPPDVYPEVAPLQDTTSWSSGWVDIAPGSAITLTHNLGGDPDDYAIELWFRDTDPGGLGISTQGIGGLEAGGNFLGGHWQNLTDTTIQVVRLRDDTFADQVWVRIWIPDPPAWDSEWVDIAPGTFQTLTHNLGGNADDYIVGLTFKDTTPGGIRINSRCYGGMEASGQLLGAAWQNFTDTTVGIWRYPNDGWADQVRVRIFMPDPPDWDSGWVDIGVGTVETLTHNLGGNLNHYIVRGWQKDTDNGIGINHRFLGGFEAGGSFFGSSWSRLSDETINVLRRADDWVADQVRMRIWVKEVAVEPSFLSATLGVGQQVTTTLTINNTGTDPLTFELTEVSGPYTPTLASPLQLRAGSGTTHVLAWTAYADLTREYPNTIAAISQFYPDFTIAETTTTDPTVLETALADKDLFLVPEQEYAGSSTIRNIATTWAGVLDAFARRGGTIVVTDLSNGVAFF